jgi:hypothetical protein
VRKKCHGKLLKRRANSREIARNVNANGMPHNANGRHNTAPSRDSELRWPRSIRESHRAFLILGTLKPSLRFVVAAKNRSKGKPRPLTLIEADGHFAVQARQFDGSEENCASQYSCFADRLNSSFCHQHFLSPTLCTSLRSLRKSNLPTAVPVCRKIACRPYCQLHTTYRCCREPVGSSSIPRRS